jgi:hypothetical protein
MPEWSICATREGRAPARDSRAIDFPRGSALPKSHASEHAQFARTGLLDHQVVIPCVAAGCGSGRPSILTSNRSVKSPTALPIAKAPSSHARRINTRCAIALRPEARCPANEMFSRTRDPRASPNARAHDVSAANAGYRPPHLPLALRRIPARMHALQAAYLDGLRPVRRWQDDERVATLCDEIEQAH